MPNLENTIPLLPCPCCGEEPQFGKIINAMSDDYGGEYVECAHCGLSTHLVFAIKESAKPNLAESWNRRASLQTAQEPSEQHVRASREAVLEELRGLLHSLQADSSLDRRYFAVTLGRCIATLQAESPSGAPGNLG